MRVWSDSLVLAIDQHPQSDLRLGIVEVLCDPLFEQAVRLILEYAERGQFRCRPVPLVESSQIEAFVLRESIISDYLHDPV